MHPLVISALETLSTANHEPGNCYSYWFKSTEISLQGRGKMGSRVGASEEIRRINDLDYSLNDYAVNIDDMRFPYVLLTIAISSRT